MQGHAEYLHAPLRAWFKPDAAVLLDIHTAIKDGVFFTHPPWSQIQPHDDSDAHPQALAPSPARLCRNDHLELSAKRHIVSGLIAMYARVAAVQVQGCQWIVGPVHPHATVRGYMQQQL